MTLTMCELSLSAFVGLGTFPESANCHPGGCQSAVSHPRAAGGCGGIRDLQFMSGTMGHSETLLTKGQTMTGMWAENQEEIS